MLGDLKAGDKIVPIRNIPLDVEFAKRRRQYSIVGSAYSNPFTV
jgi:hypothetical protein